MDELHEAYDIDVAKLNRLAAKSAERAEALKAENAKLEKRLAQYGLFREVVGDPAVEFANLRRELHRVERENERLRSCLSDASENKRLIMGEYKQLREENAKLRELIADVHEALKADRAGMFHKLTLASMEDDMRELGIENTDD